MRHISLLVVHHSESPGGDLAFIRYCHTAPKPKGNGWNDVGYHYTIGNGLPHGEWNACQDGEVETGRKHSVVGAHARGFNAHSLGICLIGHFDQTHPTARQLTALTHLLTILCEMYDLDPLDDIKGHGQLMPSKCPGKNLTSLMNCVRMAVSARMKVRKQVRSILHLEGT